MAVAQNRMALSFLLNKTDGMDSSLETVPVSLMMKKNGAPPTSSSEPRRFEQLPAQAAPRYVRQFWTPAEDSALRSLVKKHGAKNWNFLATHFEDRTAGQLRCRWAYAVSNPRSQRPFSKQEDSFILQQYEALGCKWTTIARMMKDRLGNDVKNRVRLLHRHQRRRSDA